MPEKIKLEDGTEREVLTAEETKALQDKATKAEEADRSKAEAEKLLSETSEKLKKLENKDFNFKRLRDMSAEETAKLTATELSLKKQQEELAENQSTFTKNIQESWKNEALAVMCGRDEEMKKKVLLNFGKFAGEATTKEQINERIKDAYALSNGHAGSSNPLNTMSGFSSQARGDGSNPNWAGKDVDKELYSKLGISDKDLKDYEKSSNKGSSRETGSKSGFQN
jgi:hypothetical protein